MIGGVTFATVLVVGSIAGGVGAVTLAAYLRRHRAKPGVDWFLVAFAGQTVWCLSYGLSLLVYDPALRGALEQAMWLGIVWTGIPFLGFALGYTGRADVVNGWSFRSVIGFGIVASALILTNDVHGLLWTDFRILGTFDVATVTYDFGPVAYLAFLVGMLATAAAVFLLVDTLLNYGPLFRREMAAVALSPLPPGIAVSVWILEIGPYPEVHFAPLFFVPHILLDAYAFGQTEMFERNPTTVRAAERTAVDDIPDPILVLGRDYGVVRLNPAAEAALGLSEATARERSAEELLGVDVSATDGEEVTVTSHVATDLATDGASSETDASTIEMETANGVRTFVVSISRLRDPSGTHVGFTVILSDVTDQVRRRQQVEVLNRVLRHNLRNDAGVVHGYAELLVEGLDDPNQHRMADAIERRSRALTALGEKAGTLDELFAEETTTDCSVPALVETVLAELRAEHPDATVDLAVGADATVRVRRAALVAVVENLVENAFVHHDGEGTERADGNPWVEVSVERDGDAGDVVVTVADDGPGIPDHEIEAVESGRETDLEHGSGLGLWIVEWASVALGAEVTYAAREPRGTVATVRLRNGGRREK